MAKRVVVWGTGNVGAPALRAIISHAGLELAGVVVSSEAKEGRDAGELAGLEARTGVLATRDGKALLAGGTVDAVVYAAIIENRFEEALGEILACLRAGANVVTSGLYPLQHEASAPQVLLDLVRRATSESGASLMVSGIDPGWNMDILPMLVSAVSSDITELRMQEVMNYRHYDQPDIVRNTVGLGLAMDSVAPMLEETALQTVWAPMVRLLGEALGHPVDRVTTHVERRALEKDVEIEGMGLFEKGTMGAFRFEVTGGEAPLCRRARHPHRQRLRARVGLSGPWRGLSPRGHHRQPGGHPVLPQRRSLQEWSRRGRQCHGGLPPGQRDTVCLRCARGPREPDHRSVVAWRTAIACLNRGQGLCW